jgi:Flp pilus assembly protein TadG
MMKPKTIRTDQHGVAAVEFAILLIPLIVLLFGITEFGRAMFQYDALAKSVRGAVRHLSQNSAGDASAVQIAKNIAVFGNAGGTGAALLPGLTTAMVTVCDASSCAGTHANQSTGNGAINLVTVTISGYRFTSLVPALMPNITFENISSTMRQNL